MNITQIAQSNIFFFVTTVAVILLTVLWVIILIQVIRILKQIDIISKKIQEEGSNIVSDMYALRTGIKEKGKSAFMTLLGVVAAMSATKKKTRKKS
jgi:uncharacterized membrane protein